MMTADLKWVTNTRDMVHCLNLDQKEDQEKYDQVLCEMLLHNEVLWKKNAETGKIEPKIDYTVYDDHKEKMTVGVGFNMSRKSAKDEWNNAFKNHPVSFDDVLYKKRALSHEEVMVLLNYSIKLRREALRKFYDDSWNNLRPNERLAIEDAYYNAPSLVTKRRDKKTGQYIKTNFSQHIQNYVKTGEEKYLHDAVDEMRFHSNAETNAEVRKGIQNRREVQAVMLASYLCPVYLKPLNHTGPLSHLNQCGMGHHFVKAHPVVHIKPNKSHPQGLVTSRSAHCASDPKKAT